MDHGHPKGIWHLPIRSATTINIIGNPFMNMTHRLFLKSSLFPPRVWGTVPSPLPILPARSAASTSADAGDLLLRNDVNSTGITTLTMNNPMKYNILSWAMLDVLQNQLDDIGSDSVRNLFLALVDTNCRMCPCSPYHQCHDSCIIPSSPSVS
jgi:hypothetical protein